MLFRVILGKRTPLSGETISKAEEGSGLFVLIPTYANRLIDNKEIGII